MQSETRSRSREQQHFAGVRERHRAGLVVPPAAARLEFLDSGSGRHAVFKASRM